MSDQHSKKTCDHVTKNVKGKQKANLPRTGKVSFTLVSFILFCSAVDASDLPWKPIRWISPWPVPVFNIIWNSSQFSTAAKMPHFILLVSISVSMVLSAIFCSINSALYTWFCSQSLSLSLPMKVYINAFSWLFIINCNCGIYFCLHSPFSNILLHKFSLKYPVLFSILKSVSAYDSI